MQELLEKIETWAEANGIKILNRFNASNNRETSKQIKAMKKQGKTKKAIIAELEITEGMFDKLAHA